MEILEALRKAIQQEFKFDDKLRGKLLNVIDLATEEVNNKSKKKTGRASGQFVSTEQLRRRFRPIQDREPEPEQADDGANGYRAYETTLDF